MNNKKEFIYIGNLSEKKLWFKFTARDFFILAVLGVIALIICCSTFFIQVLSIPIAWGILTVKLLGDNTSLLEIGNRMLKYLILNQQTFFWGKRSDN